MGSSFKVKYGWRAQSKLREYGRKLKRERERAILEKEEAGLQLDECQRNRLNELTDKAKNTQNYTEVYKFIQDQLPDNKTDDQKGLDRWLDFAISTNAKSGDITDVMLRNVTKATLKRTLGSDYEKQYGNEEEFNKKYKKISSETAEKIANKLVYEGKIDTRYVVNLDADNFQKFDTDFKSENGINSGRVKREDWTGSIFDEYMFGKNYIKANNWDLKDSFLGEFSTLIDFNKIKSPTTAMSKVFPLLLISPLPFQIKKIVKLRDAINFGQFPKKYKQCKCKSEDEREEAKKYIKDQEAKEALREDKRKEINAIP